MKGEGEDGRQRRREKVKRTSRGSKIYSSTKWIIFIFVQEDIFRRRMAYGHQNCCT